MDENIKADINFLDRPLWMQTAERDNSEIFRWEDQDGYKFECAGFSPSKVDMLILYFLMLESQNRNWTDTLILTQYAVLNGCGMVMGTRQRERLKQALEAWKKTTISFSGTYYSGKKYHDMQFGIVDYWGIREKDNKLEIRLNKNWIEKIQHSDFFKYISFTQMKSLRSPLALRLYEILVKSFYNRDVWEVGIKKLAEKVPMSEKYPAHIIPKVKSAVKRISEKTDLNITLDVVKQGRGKGKFVFTKQQKQKPVQGDLFADQIPDELIAMIPAAEKNNCKNIIKNIYINDGADGLRFYLEKTNSRKDTGKGSYAGYLKTISDLALYADVKAGREAEKAQAHADRQQYLEQAKNDQQQAQDRENKRAALSELKRDPERYHAALVDAATELGIDLDKKRRGDGLKLDLHIQENFTY